LFCVDLPVILSIYWALYRLLNPTSFFFEKKVDPFHSKISGNFRLVSELLGCCFHMHNHDWFNLSCHILLAYSNTASAMESCAWCVCLVAGWSGHPVCGKRYHFIIENDCNQLSGHRRTCCLRCGTPMVAGESRWEAHFRNIHACITANGKWDLTVLIQHQLMSTCCLLDAVNKCMLESKCREFWIDCIWMGLVCICKKMKVQMFLLLFIDNLEC